MKEKLPKLCLECENLDTKTCYCYDPVNKETIPTHTPYERICHTYTKKQEKSPKLVSETEEKDTPWLPQGVPQEYGSIEDLYREVRVFVYQHVDFFEDGLYDVVTCWILLTYRFNDFDVCPYLFLLGPRESGKTRVLEVLEQLGWKAIMSATITPAALFRAIEKWHPTVLLDETEIYSGEGKSDIQHILNSGYRKGQKAIRVVKVKEGELELGCFDVYGPKALAGTRTMLPTLQSRAITIYMEKKTRSLRYSIDKKQGAQLRCKLLSYHYNHDGDQEFDMGKLERELGNPRLGELFYSLIKVAPTTEIAEKLFQYAKKLDQNKREEELTSDEAVVVKAIADQLGDFQKREESELVNDGKLAIGVIANKIANDQDITNDTEIRRLTQKIGYTTKRLGFEKTRSENGKAAIKVDIKRITRLIHRYQLDDIDNYSTKESVGVEASGKPSNPSNPSKLERDNGV